MKKRFFSVLIAVVLSLTMVLPAMASENFTASVPSKEQPELVPVYDEEGNARAGAIKDSEGNVVDYFDEGCLIITPIAHVDSSDKIPEDAAGLLKEVYLALKDGSMTLPYDKVGVSNPDTMVIRDLFDVTFICEEHHQMIQEGEHDVVLTFNLGVAANAKVVAFSYKGGEWKANVTVTNNGDGTVTCYFEKFCPVAFAIDTNDYVPPIKTGDNVGNLGLWFGIMCVSGIALIAIAVTAFARKNRNR